MEEKASLLEQLRIERQPEPVRTGGRRGPWRGLVIGIAVVLLAVGGGVVYWEVSQAGAIPVQAAVARSIMSSSTGAPVVGSLLDASGYVVAMRMASISSPIIGRVDDVPIQAGEAVKKGQILAKLDPNVFRATLEQSIVQADQARAQLAAARVAAADATPIYQRDKKELALGLISQDAFDAAQQTYDAAQTAVKVQEENLAADEAAVVINQRNLDYTIIRAPFDGVVTAKNAQPGQIVSYSFSGGGGIADIVDMDSLEVDVDVSENFISRVHPNMPASITLDAYPDWHIPADVIAIIPTADKSKATVQVRVGFKQKDPRILPQMGARVSFLAEASSSADTSASGTSAGAPSGTGSSTVAVPSAAIESSGDTSTGAVYVINGNAVEKKTVRLGARNGDNQWILSGLDAGESVAIGDLSKLRDGARIRIVTQ